MQNIINYQQNEFFTQKCKQHNLKITPQRVSIYKSIIQSKNHPSTEDIFQFVKNEFNNITFDTVNRTLLTFTQIGLINVIESYKGARRFDPDLKTHHHFHCINCGRIIDFENNDFDVLEVSDDLKNRFKIHTKRVVLSGFCDKCDK
jgi:Fur family transcriptional regulator, peroxide stress response regulator